MGRATEASACRAFAHTVARAWTGYGHITRTGKGRIYLRAAQRRTNESGCGIVGAGLRACGGDSGKGKTAQGTSL
jgi:hypothetical protein